MTMTKVFTNGNSQAVRIPAEYRINADEVVIQRVGSTLVLFPKEDAWSVFQRGIDGFSADFTVDRQQPAVPARATIDEA
jgi:antitoxin VapB